MILYRRQNKSGKSSAESEGSPDEVFILEFLDRYMFEFFFPNLAKQQNTLSTFEGGRQWEEKARGADGQFAATKVFSSLSISFTHFFSLQVSVQLCRGKGEKANCKYQKRASEEVERFRKPDRLPFLSTMHVD